MTAHERPLSPWMVETYRLLTRRPVKTDASTLPVDVELLRSLGETSARVATRAFVEKDAEAWEITQAVQWKIFERTHLRPFEPADAVVLDAMYRVEESTLPWVKIERELSPDEFCKHLANQVGAYSSEDGSLAAMIESGVLGSDEWRYLGYQWLPLAVDFTRQIALASLSLPREQARVLYENLYDEVGRGDFARAHFNTLGTFLKKFDVRPDDRDEIARWVAPEVLSMANLQNRLLWHLEPGWSLGSLFLSERLVPSELGRVRNAVLKMDLAEGEGAFFDEHVVLDVAHSDEWLVVIGELIAKREDQEIALNAALQRGRAQKAAWEGAFDAFMTWKQTGVVPHVRVVELEHAAR